MSYGLGLTPTGQAIYLSELPTGALVTPYEAQALRDTAVAEHGYDGLRIAQTVAALSNASLIPEGHADRWQWADAAARMIDPHVT